MVLPLVTDEPEPDGFRRTASEPKRLRDTKLTAVLSVSSPMASRLTQTSMRVTSRREMSRPQTSPTVSPRISTGTPSCTPSGSDGASMAKRTASSPPLKGLMTTRATTAAATRTARIPRLRSAAGESSRALLMRSSAPSSDPRTSATSPCRPRRSARDWRGSPARKRCGRPRGRRSRRSRNRCAR